MEKDNAYIENVSELQNFGEKSVFSSSDDAFLSG